MMKMSELTGRCPGVKTVLTGRSPGMTPVLYKRDISHLLRQQRLLSSAGETIVKNVDIGITAATVSPIEDNCGGRRQCEDQRKPLQVVLAVLVQAMRLQAPEMRQKALVPAMRPEKLVLAVRPVVRPAVRLAMRPKALVLAVRLETLVPVMRPKLLVPAMKLTMQCAACTKIEWSYLIDMSLP